MTLEMTLIVSNTLDDNAVGDIAVGDNAPEYKLYRFSNLHGNKKREELNHRERKPVVDDIRV